MEKHDFKMDTQKSAKKNFLKKVTISFSSAMVLTGLISIVGLIFWIKGICEQSWTTMGAAAFVQKGFSYISMMCIFVSLIKIALDEKPFSKTLSYCVRMISVLYLVGAFLFPRLSGYESSGFEIFSTGDFTLLDAEPLLFGLILYLLSVLIQEGFKMQKELDEVL